MYGPPHQPTGRSMLLFAAMMFGLGCFLLLGRQWQIGGLWLAIALCIGSYGLLLIRRATAWDKILVVIGIMAGLIAFGLALSLTT